MTHERRFFLKFDDSEVAPGHFIYLPEKDRHHLTTVLRAQTGEQVVLVSIDSGSELITETCEADGEIALRVTKVLSTRKPVRRTVRGLIFSLGKNPVNDLVCEKACELGVERIIFWRSERSILSLTAQDIPAKISRWRRIAESAAKQSGRNSVPEIQCVLSLPELLSTLETAANSGERLLMCSLSAGSSPARKLRPLTTPAFVLIGPAGDLSPTEEQALLSEGFESLNLGSLRLRSETAAIVAIAAIQGAWGFELETPTAAGGG